MTARDGAVMDDPLLTVDEVATMLRIPSGTLYYWRSEGRGPQSFKIGQRVVYRTSVVTAYLAEQEQATSSEQRAS